MIVPEPRSLTPHLRIVGNRLILDNPRVNKPLTVRILDCRGRTVIQQSIHGNGRTVVPLDGYARGMYIAHLRRTDATTIRKFLVR
ncbi:MAG: T9SS type A sorting domain-containing protein [Chitinivibrionales bacterium]|nr:T9SS type A sorting domain-containing protein [Chitinivibrionales bacterium]